MEEQLSRGYNMNRSVAEMFDRLLLTTSAYGSSRKQQSVIIVTIRLPENFPNWK